MEGRKAFFFEKKKQKTFVPPQLSHPRSATKEVKVFCFFFSKKKALLPYAVFLVPRL
jgi:hypothetical protein